MPEEQTPQTQGASPSPKPDWLQGMNPQAELIKVWNDVFENNCTCDICVRLRKALSGIKNPPTGGPMPQPQP